MLYKKNDKIELDIIDMTKNGLGLAKESGIVFFVKDGIVGDKVLAIITKISKNIIYAKTIEIIEKSKYRVDTDCNVSNNCGGCQFLSLNYNKQLELKKNYVINSLKNIGKFDDEDINYAGIFGMNEPYNFRNKMQIPYAVRKGKIIYGFYAGRTHYIVEFNKCLIGFHYAEIILEVVKNALLEYNISVYDEREISGLFREVMLRKGNTSNEISITYIINDSNYNRNKSIYKEFDKTIRAKVHKEFANRNIELKIVTSTININTNNNNVLFGNFNDVLYGAGYINDLIGDVKFHISPESFYQINSVITKTLYDKIIEFANFDEKENVLDLYCGIGTISLYIARYVNRVLGIEIVKSAINDAKTNAEINNIDNADFICIDVDKLNEAGYEHSFNVESIKKNFYDTIIVDPPRKGLSNSAISFIYKLKPQKIIYVSCDPATLSRDLNILCHTTYEGFNTGYKMDKIANVDMFPHTMHVETIVRLINYE